MNYRHAYHAGNHADVFKHALLAAVIAHLREKPAAFAVIETHAGLGVYDFATDEATRSPEWRDGVGRLWGAANPPALLGPYLEAIAGLNPDGALRFYPGSPEIARALLRPQDRYAGCELHPQDAAALKARYRGDRRLQLHHRDGWEALKGLLPPAERRGLVVIDPPYEKPDELAASVEAIAGALGRFSNGVYLWWRPLKDAEALRRADAELLARGLRGALRLDLWVDTPAPMGPMNGSSIVLINPPFALVDPLRALAPDLAALLGRTPHAGARATILGAI